MPAVRVKCPKCHKTIENLLVVKMERHEYYFDPSRSVPLSDVQLEEVEMIESDIVYFKCPLCYKELDIDHDDDSGLAFLAGRPYRKVENPPPSCPDCGHELKRYDGLFGDGAFLMCPNEMCLNEERHLLTKKGGREPQEVNTNA